MIMRATASSLPLLMTGFISSRACTCTLPDRLPPRARICPLPHDEVHVEEVVGGHGEANDLRMSGGRGGRGCREEGEEVVWGGGEGGQGETMEGAAQPFSLVVWGRNSTKGREDRLTLKRCPSLFVSGRSVTEITHLSRLRGTTGNLCRAGTVARNRVSLRNG